MCKMCDVIEARASMWRRYMNMNIRRDAIGATVCQFCSHRLITAAEIPISRRRNAKQTSARMRIISQQNGSCRQPIGVVPHIGRRYGGENMRTNTKTKSHQLTATNRLVLYECLRYVFLFVRATLAAVCELCGIHSEFCMDTQMCRVGFSECVCVCVLLFMRQLSLLAYVLCRSKHTHDISVCIVLSLRLFSTSKLNIKSQNTVHMHFNVAHVVLCSISSGSPSLLLHFEQSFEKWQSFEYFEDLVHDHFQIMEGRWSKSIQHDSDIIGKKSRNCVSMLGPRLIEQSSIMVFVHISVSLSRQNHTQRPFCRWAAFVARVGKPF